ncbi:MAG: alpha/beta fold hydrolase [Alphaproteobacteria bacterium]|nr:alpha/beta fold hydrolase [Alphaproteobacteria bacterium]
MFMQTNSCKSGGTNICFYTWGEATASPIICVHGLTGTGRDFDYIAPALAQAGYYVVAPDLPGRGKSDFIKASEYGYPKYLSVLTDLIKHIDAEKVDWLGVSLGGLLGMRLAGLEESIIRNMVLSDVGPDVPKEDLDLIGQYITPDYRFNSLEEMEIGMRSSRTQRFSRGPLDDAQWKHIIETCHRKLPDGGVSFHYDPAIRENFNAEPIGEKDIWPLWENTKQPVLVLRGEWSTILPLTILQEMLRRKPGTPMDSLEINGCGHVPSLMVHEHIEPVVTWLEGHQK